MARRYLAKQNTIVACWPKVEGQGWGCGCSGVGLWGLRLSLPMHPEESHSGEHLASHSRPTSPRASKSCVEWGSNVSSSLPTVMVGRGP